jgi:hypothetical protein
VATGRKNQQLWFGREAVAGVADEDAMIRFGGIDGHPTYVTTQTKFSSAGSRVTDAIIPGTEMGGLTINSIQDYNALTAVFDSVLGVSTPTTPDGATLARSRKWNLYATGAITPETWTVVYGNASQALKLLYGVFNSFGLTINRGTLGFTTSFLARMASTGATLPSSGTTFVPAAPIPARSYSVYSDAAWADLGDTKLLNVYDMGLTFPERWAPDWPINAANASFDSIIETENTEHTMSMQIGMSAGMVTELGAWTAGTRKYFRIESVGGLIEAGQNYELLIDLSTSIVMPGEFTTAPMSPTWVLPFTYELVPDPVTLKVAEITLINAVAV